ncbi:putative secreted protein [Wickerhamomyces ciferrii]|uniref:Secreted protein n=1 Tax=Wickerhamomyces ciferrii (strain ATCC 14091 / BCRC 22168 / CBS 111 / JCM 3599 / NBRC 0793 / NRRL Y-1031 F-60-10) TaxID=1206466 RepID=K0KY81_WICCF|nr:uncharacterized protein BN7_6003 [Wickerhamomyces ciferrii]CCH46409.1 putative secreted protein [Wickerhamomyces ciferrii]
MQFKSLALYALASLQLTSAASIYGRADKDPSVSVTKVDGQERFKYEVVFDIHNKGVLSLDIGLIDHGSENTDLDKSSGVHYSENLYVAGRTEFYQSHVKGTWNYNGDGQPATLTIYGGGVGNGPLGEGLKFNLNGSFDPDGGDDIEYKDIASEL